MTDPDIELERGSGNVFTDLKLPAPGLEQLRAVLAARIVSVLDDEGLTLQAAQDLSGFAAADFSRLRRARLDRFTIDRLMTMLARLGHDVDVAVSDRPSGRRTQTATAPAP